MPLYEYRCEKCGQRVEKIQKFSDPPLKTCSKCGGKLERLVSASAIQFKGSGWYVTDYARKSDTSESAGAKEKSESSTKPDGASGTAEGGGKADTSGADKKPAEKKPAKTKSSK